eukprot:scaffold9921_cov112-Isochrysis_galbana.AAC.11
MAVIPERHAALRSSPDVDNGAACGRRRLLFKIPRELPCRRVVEDESARQRHARGVLVAQLDRSE